MALEDITTTIAGESIVVELLAAATAANGVPAGAVGIGVNKLKNGGGPTPDKIRVGIRTTAGTGVITVTARVWGRAGEMWFRLKDLNASSTAPHTAVAIPETGTDSIAYSEEVAGVKGCDRLYLELIAVAGTTPTFVGYAIVGR